MLAVAASMLAAGILEPTVAVAEELYRVDRETLDYLEFCDGTEVWRVARLPAFCDSETCIERGELDWLGMGQNGPLIQYRAPFPNPYSGELWYQILSSSQAAAWLNYRGSLVPTDLLEPGPDPLQREAQLGNTDSRRFFDLLIDNRYKARAICDSSLSPEGMALPTNCVVIRMKVDEVEYFLSPTSNLNSISCPSSGLSSMATNFGLPTQISTDHFLGQVVIRLISGRLGIGSDSIEFVGSDSRPIILASAGPQLSQIDPSLREKLEVTVLASIVERQPSVPACIPEGNADQCPDEAVILTEKIPFLSFEFRVSAWVGRQNVDPTGEWVWPDSQYYDAIFSDLKIYVNEVFSAECASLGLKATANFASRHNEMLCLSE
jgi:hypothetical protein